MDVLLSSTAEAFRLLFSGNPEIWEIVGISFRVSTMAILAAVPFALVIAFALAYLIPFYRCPQWSLA
jgi:tungstate transport system permease protein